MVSYLKGEDISLSFYTLAPGGCLILGINFVDGYFKSFTIKEWGTRGGGQLVEALCYDPEGRGFGSRWRKWNSSLT